MLSSRLSLVSGFTLAVASLTACGGGDTTSTAPAGSGGESTSSRMQTSTTETGTGGQTLVTSSTTTTTTTTTTSVGGAGPTGTGGAGPTGTGGAGGSTTGSGGAGVTGAGGAAVTGSGGGTTTGSGGASGVGGATSSTGTSAMCATPSDCPPTGNGCVVATCESGACGTANATQGTIAPNQTLGDCQVLVCDGMGNPRSVEDDNDLPKSTSCAIGQCTSGAPTFQDLPGGTLCDGGGHCDGMGTCQSGCFSAADCPGADTDCQTRTCVAFQCGLSFAPNGKPTSQQTPGDCHESECDGAGNVVTVVDDADPPATTETCAPGVCVQGTPSHVDAARGTACTENGGTECDGNGSCVQCVIAADCGVDTECQQHTCTGGQCGVNDVADGTPTAQQTPGDCRQNQCDGAGNIVDAVDDSDKPSGATCAPGSCSNGTPGTTPAAQGSACTDGGGVTCDGQGSCSQTVSIVRVGTGSAALASTATATFVETYYPIVGSTPVSTITLPTTISGSNQPLLLSGTATSEGGLSRSGDGHFLQLAGYAGVAGMTTTGTTRVVGRTDAAGNVDTTTRLAAAAFSGSNVRGAASVDGQNFWVSGTSSTATGGGLWYVLLGAALGGTQIDDTPNNMRMSAVFLGQLFGTSASGGFVGVVSFGGLPTTPGATTASLPGETTSNALGFAFTDANTLYAADGSSGLSRWTFVGGVWVKDATFAPFAGACFGVAAWSTGNGAGAVLVATTSAGALQRVDVSPVGVATATLLVTAAANTAYRGAALAPH